MKTLKKINEAVLLIKASDTKKLGWNSYSKYNYFTPEQIEQLVIEACEKVKIFPKFDLIRNEFGIFGRLSIYDLEADTEPVTYEMASAIPDITATNETQQLGGCVTYTNRYLYMTAFKIADNDLDPDNTPKPKPKPEPKKPWLNEGTPEWTAALKFLDEGGTIEKIKEKYAISKRNQEKLITQAI